MRQPSAIPPGVAMQSNSLFPTFESLAEAEEFAYSRLPVTTQNDMLGILKSYENTVRAVDSFDTRS